MKPQRFLHKGLLIICRGPSGSGKSTLIQKLQEVHTEAKVYSSDALFMVNGEYVFVPSRLEANHKKVKDMVRTAMQNLEKVIIIDNTNITFKEMKPYVVLAKHYGYVVEFVEPTWCSRLRHDNGYWNPNFIKSMQDSPGRNKRVPDKVVEKHCKNYQYHPTFDSVLESS